MINKHGLTINGLRQASGATVTGAGMHYNIYYNMTTGDVWTKEYPDAGGWTLYQTNYDDDDIIYICDSWAHLTMQQISDMIAEEVERLAIWRKNFPQD